MSNRLVPVDDRTTAEVEETRSYWNRKPYRTASLKLEARRNARRMHGTFVSTTPTFVHPRPLDDRNR